MRHSPISLRLRPFIVTLLVLLTLPVFVATVALSYLSDERIARSNAYEQAERFREGAIASIHNVFAPIKSMVKGAAAIGHESPDFYSDNRAMNYLLGITRYSETITSVYVGLEDASFRQARRIDPKVKIHDNLPPPDTQFAYRWIDAPKQAKPVDRYQFLDAGEKEVGRSNLTTAYDPRPRPWYRSAIEAGGPTVSDPDVFAALGLVGFTIAAPFYRQGKLIGVAAADITLDVLSEYLSKNKISPGTLSYVLDHQGRVIANSERLVTYNKEKGKVELQHITSLGNKLPAIAFGSHEGHGEKLFTFEHAGKQYFAGLSKMPPEFGKEWQLFFITPLEDFTAGFDRQNRYMLMLGLLAILLQMLVIYVLSKVLSAPLEKLATNVTRIQQFKNEPQLLFNSPIREVAVLSKAIHTLDALVSSFAAFVPVGLVRQLLETNQKLAIGGHSRFLTIFFSDLESFTTLSEQVPTQELLLRVSAYLEVVTKSINQESGTVDKFIGDGVMAFWGAPVHMDDHAWSACVAALRIQVGMKALNARWVAEDLKPLNARIGIHSDAVLVGNIGSEERISYTVMGDGVNIASRLENVNKEYGTLICVSHSVYKEAGERLCMRPIDDAAVKGRRGRITIYELMGAFGAGPELEPSAATIRLCKLTRNAYNAMSAGDLAQALRCYQEILIEYPGDSVALTMSARLTTSATGDASAQPSTS
jgi:adenylate cyclase